MDRMVLEKQDSGISLSMVGVDGHDVRMSEVESSSSTERLNHADGDKSGSRQDQLSRHDDDEHDQHDPECDLYRLRRATAAPPGGDDDVHIPLHKSVCCALCRKKQERQERLRKSEKGAHKGSQESITDGCSMTSSRVSRPWIRDPTADAKPVTDPVLRQKLQALNTGTTRLNSRDQKLLQVMIAKREAERKRQEEREALRRKWEEEQHKQSAAKNSAENRRRSVAEKKRATSSLSCLHNHNGSTTSCNCGRNHDRQVDVTPRAVKDGSPYHRVNSTPETEHCQRSWIMASQKRNELLKKQMEEKKMRELERRKSVEKRLEEQRRAEEEHQRKLREKQQRDLEKAEMVRASREQQKELNRRLKIYQAQQRYKERTEQLKRESMEDLVAMKASIELQDHLVEGKHKELVGRKEREAKRRSLDLDNRLKQSKENKQKLDEELQRWHEELLLYRQQQERRAEELAQQRVLEKARRAHEERLTKQKLQKENMKKLLSAEEEWKAEVEATIALKDSKSKMIQQEKEEIIQQSRAMAHAAQLLREELRQHYSLTDLDKLNKQAQLEARLSMKTLPSTTSSMAKLNVDD